MNVDRTRIWLNDILRHPDWFAFLLRGFIKRQRVPVYPVERVFLGEIRGKDDQLYALDATKYFACLAVNTHSPNTAPLGRARRHRNLRLWISDFGTVQPRSYVAGDSSTQPV